MGNVIEFERVSKSFGACKALDDFTLLVPHGEVVGLIGPNGAGKTTALRIALGILRPDRGTVRLLGEDPWNNSEVKKYVGVAPERPTFIETMTCEEWLSRIAKIYGVADYVSKVKHVLELVGLYDKRRTKIKALSAGMKQKLNLAQAIMIEPRLLVLDEPLTNLDPISRNEVLNLLSRIYKEKKVSMIIASHIIPELLRIVTKIAIVNKGKVCFYGSVDDVRKHLKHTLFRVYSSDNAKLLDRLRDMSFVKDVRIQGNELIIVVEHGMENKLYSELSRIALELNVEIYDVESRAPSLEELLKG